jgi:Glycosyltransferase sugar-binding region containing DXD motif
MRVHMLWAFGELSQLELLCVNSFVKQGFDLSVWSYNSNLSCPSGATLRDAREVLPESTLLNYQRSSIAAFSDLFRYAVLMQHSGLYVDTDVIALRNASLMAPQHPFLVTERTQNSSNFKINGNVIYCPNPERGVIIDLALSVAKQFSIEKMEWGDIGPNLLTALHCAYPKVSFQLMPPEFANPINWWQSPEELLTQAGHISENTFFLHCFNEMWRQKGIDKNAPFPAGSMMETLAQKYL